VKVTIQQAIGTHPYFFSLKKSIHNKPILYYI